MKTIKTRGLVLKEYETGEADKRILLMCKEHGRIMAYARGARKPRSKFMAAAQMFTYSNFVLAQGRGFFSVTQADVIESFYDLRTDYDRLCAAHSITDICDKTLLENSNCNELLLLVLKSLSHLTKGKLTPTQITSVFMLRFFDLYGLRPTTNTCAVCGADIANVNALWGAEGFTCKDHAQNRNLPLSAAAAAAVSFILNNELPQSFRFEVTESVLEELQNATKLLWDFHFSR